MFLSEFFKSYRSISQDEEKGAPGILHRWKTNNIYYDTIETEATSIWFV